MIIISEVPDEKYLVKVTQRELSIILNAKFYPDSSFRKVMESAIKNETQLNPSVLYHHFNQIKTMISRKEVESTIDTLKQVIELLSPLRDQIKEIADCYPDEIK